MATIDPTADYDESVWTDMNRALDTLENIGEDVCVGRVDLLRRGQRLSTRTSVTVCRS